MNHSRADDRLSEGIMTSVSVLAPLTTEPNQTSTSTAETERPAIVEAQGAAKKQGVEETLRVPPEVAMNRTRGDMAMELGDYKKAIEHFKKWKGAKMQW